MNYQELSPADVGSGLYGLLTRTVVPRPIAFVSTVSAEGVRNLAPFSYFMLGGGAPPSMAFSPSLRSGGVAKDTLANILDTREYTVNLVTREIVEGMNATAAEFEHEVDEWEVAGLAAEPSQFVRPEYVALSPASFSCRLFQVVSHGSVAGSAQYVIGEIVGMRLREDLLAGSAAQVVGRMGGAQYIDLDGPAVFELLRP